MTHNKPVTLVAGGTRGDVQPYILLARELRRQGIDAQVAASARWLPLINGAQVPYRQLPADPVELLLQPRFHGALTLTHGIGVGVRATWRYLREMRPFVTALTNEIPLLQHESRAIVAGVASQWVAHPTVWRTTPFMWGVFQPIAPTRDFVSPMVAQRLPRSMNRLSHQFINRLMWLSWRLHGVGAGGGLVHINAQLAFFAFSRQLVPPWSDMAPQHAITGWMGSGDAPPTSVEMHAFFDESTPFVVATFGTPAENESIALYELVIQTCQQLGVRLILQVPPHLTRMSVPAGVLLVGDAIDHQMVFARAAAVIHHGGAGTTHACLEAGTPMLIVPRGIDQFFWADRVYAAQLAPVRIDRTRVTVASLTCALNDVLQVPHYRERMQVLRQAALMTNGTESAAQYIRRVL